MWILKYSFSDTYCVWAACGSILYLFTSKQRKVGSRKRETGEPDLADFIFKIAGRVMVDDCHIYRTASHPNVFLSRCQFTRKGRQEFSPP